MWQTIIFSLWIWLKDLHFNCIGSDVSTSIRFSLLLNLLTQILSQRLLTILPKIRLWILLLKFFPRNDSFVTTFLLIFIAFHINQLLYHNTVTMNCCNVEAYDSLVYWSLQVQRRKIFRGYMNLLYNALKYYFSKYC